MRGGTRTFATYPQTGQVPTTFLGTGCYLPEARITNEFLESLVDTSDEWIKSRTGISERRRVGPMDTAVTMAAAAGRLALQHAGCDEPDAIILATSSSGDVMPSTACLVQEVLGLNGMPAFDLNAACSGFVYAAATAHALVSSGSAGTVLIIASEVMTGLTDFSDRTTCVLFGDGASAAVIGPCAAADAGIRAISLGADGREADLIVYEHPSDGKPGGIRMAGRGTYRSAVERICSVTLDLCQQAGWSPDQVSYFVPHQANARIIEAAAARLNVEMSRVILNVARFGNTGGASVGVALDEAVSDGRIKKGDKVIAMAFGAGSTWGGFALEWSQK